VLMRLLSVSGLARSLRVVRPELLGLHFRAGWALER
jgi:hypothetical protein